MANHGHELSVKNELYASAFDKGHLPLPPSKKLVVGKYIPWIDYLDSKYYHGYLQK